MRNLRFVEIHGDHLQPMLYRRDYVLVAAANGWSGEGLYAFDQGHGDLAVYDCSVVGSHAGARIRLGNHLEVAGCKVYSDQLVTRADFERTVAGKVAMTCRVQDHALINQHALAA